MGCKSSKKLKPFDEIKNAISIVNNILNSLESNVTAIDQNVSKVMSRLPPEEAKSTPKENPLDKFSDEEINKIRAEMMNMRASINGRLNILGDNFESVIQRAKPKVFNRV